MKKQKNNIDIFYPGPQKPEHSFNFLIVFLGVLTTVFFLLTIYSIFQSNKTFISSTYLHYFSFEVLDTKTSCSIFISLISLILIRHHFILGFRPRIIYESKKTSKSIFFDENSKAEIWQIKIRNVGLGAAVFKKYTFRYNQNSVDYGSHDLNFKDLTSKLESNNILLEKDYCLTNITNGYTLPSKEEKVIFEIKISFAQEIKQIDLEIQFEGLLGGIYKKGIYLLPRLGYRNHI